MQEIANPPERVHRDNSGPRGTPVAPVRSSGPAGRHQAQHHQAVSDLQRSAGNAAVSRMMKETGPGSNRLVLQREVAAPATQEQQSPPPCRTNYRVTSGDIVYRVSITGHASPRWRDPGRRTAGQRNLDLSRRRALEVEQALRWMFAARARAGQPSAPFAFECTGVEGGSQLETNWMGSSSTIHEAEGDFDSNHPSLRRVDVAVEVEQAVDIPAVSRTRRRSTATDQWAIRVVSVLSGGEVVGASVGMGDLKNRRTGRRLAGYWGAVGGTIGIEAPLPAAPPNPQWANFTTTRPIDFGDFEDTRLTFTALDVGVGAAGYSWAYIGFPAHAPEVIRVSGFVLNQWGAAFSATTGSWSFREPIPESQDVQEEVSPARSETQGQSFFHQVMFATDEFRFSSGERRELSDFHRALP